MTQPELLRKAVETLETLQIPYMLVGSLASMVYGEPRMTNDIDIVVDLRLDQVEALCAAFPSSDYYVSPHAAAQAVQQRRQFNVLHPATGEKIDFMIARNDPWGRLQITRRVKQLLLPDLEGYAAAPEDVIIAKLIYYREGGSDKHLRDITGILKSCSLQLDINYITEWAGKMDLIDNWNKLLERVKQA